MEQAHVQGVFGLMPTPAIPNSSDWTIDNTVNLDEAQRAADALAEGGLAGIMCNGTLGECSTLSAREHISFASAVVKGAAGRSKVIVGPTMGGTKTTIERAKQLADTGIDGFLLGRPMWNALDEVEIIEFYSAVAKAVPDLAIVIYDNPIAFKGEINAQTYEQLSHIPQVVASKLTAEGGESAKSSGTFDAVGDRMVLMQLDTQWYEAHKADPAQARACWSSGVSCGPAPVIALQDAIVGGDDQTAAEITEELLAVRELTYPLGRLAELSRNPVAVIKPMVKAAGFMDPGPARPPHHTERIECAEAGRRAGTRWRELHKKYESRGSRAPGEPA